MKRKTHVLVTYTTGVACGSPGANGTGMYREAITCHRCRKTPEFKALKALPRKYRKK